MNEIQKEEIRNMVGFPEDVIIDILVRLPSKVLARSRCVSKYWDTLITSPSFIKAHLNRASKLCHLICQESNLSELMMHELNVHGYSYMDPEVHSFSKLKMRFSGCSEFSNLDLHPAITNGFNNFKLVDSFNGIVCLYALNKTTSTSRIWLWNPAINDCFIVLEPRFPLSSAKSCCVGFGFNPLTNHLSDFKVVSVTLCYEGWPIYEKFSPRAEIYSRRTNSWKEIVGWIPNWPSSGNQVIFEEYICWNPYYRTWNGDDYNDTMTIVSFNVVSEEFHEMSLPDSIPFNYNKGCIALLDGCVSLMVPYSEGYEVWTMKEFGNIESWSKLYNIVFDSTIDDDFATGMSTPLGFASTYEAFFLRWYSFGIRDSTNKKMCSYDTRTRIVDESKSITFDDSFEVFCLKLYTESLIPLSYVFRLEEGPSSD